MSERGGKTREQIQMQVNHVENNSIGYWEHSVLVYEGTEIMFRE